ncbi:MAG TPA: Ig-like domain-containing protein, partial [Thermoanaerobaculia bacterium]|nr:Ig-like domain-containing protein [Thermoanaerobaculia bacterium]
MKRRPAFLAVSVCFAVLTAVPALALDTAAPSSRIDSPSPGANLPVGQSVSVRGTAQDFGGGVVQSVEVSIDGGGTWTRASGTTSWSFQWTPAAPGSVTISSRATDNSGNVEVP